MAPLKTLTRADKKAYLESPRLCPFCKEGENLECDAVDFVTNRTIHQMVTCVDCGAQWTDVFKLTLIEQIQEGEHDHDKG